LFLEEKHVEEPGGSVAVWTQTSVVLSPAQPLLFFLFFAEVRQKVSNKREKHSSALLLKGFFKIFQWRWGGAAQLVHGPSADPFNTTTNR
jgi:hypothetical protein